MTPLELMGELVAARPIPPSLAQPLASARTWKFEGGTYAKLAPGLKLDHFHVLHSRPRHWTAAYLDPARSHDWRNYSARVRVSALGDAASGANGSLIVGQDGHQATVTVSAGRVTLIASGGRRWSEKIPEASAHLVEADMILGRLIVSVDGRPVFDRRTPVRGGVGLGIWREHRTSGTPRFNGLIIRQRPTDAH
jgi:hypothetical protein